MSLLMDALRKAEEEKKKKKKQFEEAEARLFDTKEISGHEQKKNEQLDITESEFTEVMSLSLDPPYTTLDETVDEPVPENDKVSKKESVADDVSEDIIFHVNNTDTAKETGIENTKTLFDDALDDTIFNGQKRPQACYEETVPSLVSEQLIRGLGGSEYQPTFATAQTVFSAGRAASREKKTFSLGIFFVLVFLVTVFFSVLYYFSVPRQLPKIADVVALSSEPLRKEIADLDIHIQGHNVVDEMNIDSETGQNSVIIAHPDIQQNRQEKPPEKVSGFEVEDMQKNDATPKKTENESDIQRKEYHAAPPVISVIDKDVATIEKTEIIDIQADDKKTAKEVGEVSEDISSEKTVDTKLSSIGSLSASTEMFSISKTVKKKEQSTLAKEAYKAYKTGRLEVARSLYLDLLKEKKNHRPAYLGLAAIALHEGNKSIARSYYTKLLQINPDDIVAISSLVSLYDGSELEQGENTIKSLIQREGNIPYLHFVLGKIYARQLRWSEAEQAFFDAYRLDTTNPDYALNLAVSLDHIGQYAMALDYYKTTIRLVNEASAKFDYASVSNRINLLANLLN